MQIQAPCARIFTSRTTNASSSVTEQNACNRSLLSSTSLIRTSVISTAVSFGISEATCCDKNGTEFPQAKLIRQRAGAFPRGTHDENRRATTGHERTVTGPMPGLPTQISNRRVQHECWFLQPIEQGSTHCRDITGFPCPTD